MKKLFFSVLATLIMGIGSIASAQQLTGLQIMKENDKQFDFKTEVSDMTMELINSSNKKRSRTVERFSMKDDAGLLSTLIKFLQPADVKGSGFLSVENSKDDETRYLYLPALRKSRRISTGEDSDSFMGSDFTYEDIDEMVMEDYSFKLIGSETVNGIDCHKVEAVPSNEERKKISGYSKSIYYVSKDNFIVNKVDFYDKHGELFKILKGTNIKAVPGTTNFYRAYTLTMENLKTKHKTILSYSNIQINTDVDEEMFSVRMLERGN
ncbi:MAG: outer membrane lipoprotein-sorting protein [Bacteroidales bacterium]